MPSRFYTIETRLNVNSDFVDYLSSILTDYSSIKRKMFHMMTNPNYKTNFKTPEKFVSFCCKLFKIHSRAVNSLRHEIEGEISAYFELKKTELSAVKHKIKTVKKRILKLKEMIEGLKPKVILQKVTKFQLKRYRKWKRELFRKQNYLNKLNNKVKNLRFKIDNHICKICFGTRKLFDKQNRLLLNNYENHQEWYDDFVKNRDKMMFFSGSKGERLGNLLLNLDFNPETGKFNLKFRKLDTSKIKRAERDNPDAFATYRGLKFKHLSENVKKILEKHINDCENKQGLSFRFLRRNCTKWYVQIIFEESYDDSELETSAKYGVIGLDLNDGFIQLAETNCSGNLIRLEKFDLKYHGCGNKAKTEMYQILNRIVKYAHSIKKDISAEDLDFKNTKAYQLKAKSKKGKKYNRMLSAFDYSRYKTLLTDICFNNKVALELINPVNTSKTGIQKYSDSMKLTSHQAAAFVIARRHQGFKDKYIKKKNK